LEDDFVNNNTWDEIYHKIKKVFSARRTRAALYAAVVLWVAVITQIAVNRIFREELQITEAFVKSETVEMQSNLEVVAEYKAEVLSEAGKKELINRLADAIGLTVDSDITVWEDEDRTEYFYYKKAKQAATEIKVISLQTEENNAVDMKHYIVVRLNILKGMESIDKYKGLIEDELNQIGVASKQVNLKYEGNREGNLTSLQKHEIAVLLIDELQGEIALEYDEGDIYTVYAYTGMIHDYVTSMSNRINIQIAITYNELTDTTRITLATPVLNDSF
jgi:hypothetical protein